jgi:uncharacterized protein (TIGR04141 family)
MARITSRPRTRRQTLYLLTHADPGIDGLLDAVDAEKAGSDYDLDFPDLGGIPAVLVHGAASSGAAWCADASATTGMPMRYTDRTSGAVLLLEVDRGVYAVSYGAGHGLIRDELKDQRFGLRFAVRQLDADRIHRLVHRMPGGRGRQDSVLVPGGLPIWCYGLDGYARVVGHIGGELKQADLTFCRDGSRRVRINGSAGLDVRLGVLPADLLGDIRAVAEVCSRRSPDPLLESIENIAPVADPAITGRLDADLDEVLGWPDDEASGFVSPDVPMTQMDGYLSAHSLAVKIGSARRLADHLDLREFLRRTRLQDPGARLEAMRRGYVRMFADADGTEPLGGSSAINWIEAALPMGPRRFFLLDGAWYEIAAGYLTAMRARVERLLGQIPSLDLPKWSPGSDERRYNEHVQDARPRYICLDRDQVRAGLHREHGFEACDLLGPGNELIHVKRARESSPLSHLFSQALVSAQALATSPDARALFTAKVRAHPKGRDLPADFQPKKVVFAILLKNGEKLTTDTLFPFSQVTLASTAQELESRYQIPVEVIGIAAEGS